MRLPPKPTRHRILPFSNSSRPSIIEQVSTTGEWHGERKGAHVKFILDRTLLGNVTASCRIGHRTISFPADHVSAAIDECNRLILSGGRA